MFPCCQDAFWMNQTQESKNNTSERAKNFGVSDYIRGSDKAKQRRMLYTWFPSSHLRLYILPHSKEENENCSKTVLFTSDRAVLALCQANSASLTFSQCLTCGHLQQPFRGLTVISTSGLQDFSALECSVCLLQTIKPLHWTMKLSLSSLQGHSKTFRSH